MKRKTCTICGVIKRIDDFYYQKTGIAERTSSCKVCRRTKQQEYSLKNIDKKKESSKKWYVNNKEERSEYNKQWRKDNPDYYQYYYENNTEKRLEINRKSKLKKKESMK